MNYTIRKATPDDFEIVQKLNHMLFVEEHEKGHDDVLDLEWPHNEHGKKYYTEALSDPDKAAFLVFNNDTPIGCIIGAVKNIAHITVKKGEIENMIVLSEARRHGVGNALIDHMKRWMKKRSVQRVVVSAYERNSVAKDFYTACGFDPKEITFELKI